MKKNKVRNAVTVEDCKLHCRVDSDAENEWFELMLPAVFDNCAAFVGGKSRLFTSKHRVYLLNAVRAAMLIEIAELYKNREGNDRAEIPANWGHGHNLGYGATKLLTPLRKPLVS